MDTTRSPRLEIVVHVIKRYYFSLCLLLASFRCVLLFQLNLNPSTPASIMCCRRRRRRGRSPSLIHSALDIKMQRLNNKSLSCTFERKIVFTT